MSKVTIETKELIRLVRDSLYLQELDAWGLDNWSGMEYVEEVKEDKLAAEISRLTNDKAE